MKKVRNYNAAMALGSLTAAVALLAGVPVASAQTAPGASDNTTVSGQAAAPGGGSFPGSFLVPGTNTSIKIGGFAKLAYIFDASGPPQNGIGGTAPPSRADTIGYQNIPLEGQPAHSLHGSTRFTARQSNVNFDVRTPTAWGELDTFILIDFFGRENVAISASAFANNGNPDTARLVLAYGTLGPLAGGQMLDLWFDGDSLPEVVDPTATAGVMNGNSNRQPQIRYTYAGAGGLSAAVAIEQPASEGAAGIGGPFATNNIGGIERIPDVVARGRLDQAWGHGAVTALYRPDIRVTAPGLAHATKQGYGIEFSGHLNTIGKDTLRGQAMVGRGLGHYLTDFIDTGGLQANTLTGTTTTGAGEAIDVPLGWGANVSYTHWWTNELRSSIDAGYAYLHVTSAFTAGLTAGQRAAALAGLDKRHYNFDLNLIWSPVPQVDLGIEYDYGSRQTNFALLGGNSSKGELNRIEAMTVFKF